MNFQLLENRISEIENRVIAGEPLKELINNTINITKTLNERHHGCIILKRSDAKIAVKLENLIFSNYNTLIKNYNIKDDKYFLINTTSGEEKTPPLKQIEIMLKKLRKAIDE